jgi:DNA transposition AAA+ family ATPase
MNSLYVGACTMVETISKYIKGNEEPTIRRFYRKVK